MGSLAVFALAPPPMLPLLQGLSPPPLGGYLSNAQLPPCLGVSSSREVGKVPARAEEGDYSMISLPERSFSVQEEVQATFLSGSLPSTVRAVHLFSLFASSVHSVYRIALDHMLADCLGEQHPHTHTHQIGKITATPGKSHMGSFLGIGTGLTGLYFPSSLLRLVLFFNWCHIGYFPVLRREENLSGN